MYAYNLWLEELDSMVCREYLQMERACRLQQDDRLLREKQQEKATEWQCDYQQEQCQNNTGSAVCRAAPWKK